MIFLGLASTPIAKVSSTQRKKVVLYALTDTAKDVQGYSTKVLAKQ